jgi:hypothetical protein
VKNLRCSHELVEIWVRGRSSPAKLPNNSLTTAGIRAVTLHTEKSGPIRFREAANLLIRYVEDFKDGKATR